MRTHNLYKDIIAELSESGAAYAERFASFYIASIGAHRLNLANQRYEFYVRSRKAEDTRLHVLFIAPPGFSKTFWLSQFLRGKYAILTNSGIDISMEATLTGAGFVGTVKFAGQGESVREPGLAESHSTGIIGVEEFAAITAMFKKQHSSELDTALLQALDSGYVYKRLAAGPIKYRTFLTLHTGCQPARVDLTSGLGRRFIFVEYIPTRADFEMMKHARRNSVGKRANMQRLERIRKGIRKLGEDMNNIKDIKIDEDFYTFMDDHNVIHYEEVLYERLLLGLSVMRGKYDDKCIYAEVDEVAKNILTEEISHRKSIKRGSEYSQVLTILKDYRGSASISQVTDMLLTYGCDYTQAIKLTSDMSRLGMIEKRGNKLYLPNQ